MVVKWSAFLTPTPTIQVRILLVFSVTFMFEKNENKLKEAVVCPLHICILLRFKYFVGRGFESYNHQEKK